MRARRASSLFLLLFACVAAAGQSDSADPITLLGMDLPSAYAALGAPQEVLSHRGETPEQDDVVFFYPDFRSLFWYKNRVWQVRYDPRYAGSVLGFRIGMPRADAERVAPGLLQAAGDSLYLSIDTTSWPVRLRLVLEEDRIADMYLFRSDY